MTRRVQLLPHKYHQLHFLHHSAPVQPLSSAPSLAPIQPLPSAPQPQPTALKQPLPSVQQPQKTVDHPSRSPLAVIVSRKKTNVSNAVSLKART
ncbi:hypothetical protein PoB_001099000 [Plakobranchus ocellatus]|uniref:Uncharacterized protein n=1 Tax=Plakobranchus ocellatus TaxID=259542 RepID=A0AAV3YN23_9GAST|nr:hypothetical protein PoB_001099000 [Plakobranchus ocellatus]